MAIAISAPEAPGGFGAGLYSEGNVSGHTVNPGDYLNLTVRSSGGNVVLFTRMDVQGSGFFNGFIGGRSDGGAFVAGWQGFAAGTAISVLAEWFRSGGALVESDTFGVGYGWTWDPVSGLAYLVMGQVYPELTNIESLVTGGSPALSSILAAVTVTQG